MATRRRNPLSFDVSPEARRASDPRSRTAVSMYSPIKQRAVVERFVDTPHNYNVILLSPNEVPSKGGWFDVLAAAQPHARPDAVNLLQLGDPNPDPRRDRKRPGPRYLGESIYTPFIYLHRLGDEVMPSLIYGGGPSGPQDPALTALAEKFFRALRGPFSWPERYSTFRLLLASRVNSKAVREGYAADQTQAAADLMALAELTLPERPLLRPFENFDEFRAHARRRVWFGSDDQMAGAALRDGGYLTPETMQTLNAYMAQHNILWRAWHDRYIRSRYGEIVRI